MAKSTVFRSFEVCEGFGPGEAGPVVFSSDSRAAADAAAEQLAESGTSAEVFGIRSEAGGDGGSRVLLRCLVALRPAA